MQRVTIRGRARLITGALLLGGMLLLGTEVDAAPPAALKEARQVIVRGHTELAEAIAAAAGGSASGTGALVLDVTPHTRAARPALEKALMQLGTRRGVPRRWRIARLGDTFSPAVPDAARLAPLIPTLLATDTAARDTVGALKRSIKSLGTGEGAVIYLADWRFEDEHDIEGLVKVLSARKLRFGVVGSEAAFGRGWHDGVANAQQPLALDGNQDPHDPEIGRHPFGPFDRDAPWHGGDTATPHGPYRFAAELWVTEFSPGALRFQDEGVLDLGQLAGKAPDLEDLRERLGRMGEASSFARFPLPASFGPHGLMRTAALRDGRYVLWSWNPQRRVSIRYEPARCDTFGPDLRSRAQIRRTLGKRPAAAAMLRAWHTLTQRRTAVVAHTPPLGKGARGPQSVDLLDHALTQLGTTWCERGQWRAFVDKATDWHAALAQAASTLTRGIEKAAKDDGPAAARLRADAELFRHIVAVLHFEVGEALAAAKQVKADDFGPEHCLTLRPLTWIERGDDPDAIRTSDVPLQDAAGGGRLKDARAAHLRRYRGTPFGLQVAANTVDTWRVEKRPRLEVSPNGTPPGRSPAESGGDTPDTPPPRGPGGPSGGGGPSTGGRR